jgi:hypothetical protein
MKSLAADPAVQIENMTTLCFDRMVRCPTHSFSQDSSNSNLCFTLPNEKKIDSHPKAADNCCLDARNATRDRFFAWIVVQSI